MQRNFICKATLRLVPLKQDLWSCVLSTAFVIQIWYRYLLQSQKWRIPVLDCKVIETCLNLQQLYESFTLTWDFSLELLYHFKVKIHFLNQVTWALSTTGWRKGTIRHTNILGDFEDSLLKSTELLKTKTQEVFCSMVSSLRWSCYYYSLGIC